MTQKGAQAAPETTSVRHPSKQARNFQLLPQDGSPLLTQACKGLGVSATERVGTVVGEPLRGTSRLQVEMSLQGKLLPSLRSPAPVSLPGRPSRAEAESSSPRGRRGDQTPPTSLAPATRALEHAEPAALGVLPLSPRSTCQSLLPATSSEPTRTTRGWSPTFLTCWASPLRALYPLSLICLPLCCVSPVEKGGLTRRGLRDLLTPRLPAPRTARQILSTKYLLGKE